MYNGSTLPAGNTIIPDEFKIDGNLTLKWDKAAFTESVTLLAMVIVIVVIISLLAQHYIKKI